MSKYTTEVRFICEQSAGLTESAGYDKVNEVIQKSYAKIFDNFPIFDESYREGLCCKILKHYYLREICSETVGVWKLWLNERMEQIMPYYNQLYESAKLSYEPFYDTDYSTTGKRSNDYGEKTTNDRTTENTRTDDLQNKRTDNLQSKRTDNLANSDTTKQTSTGSNTDYNLYSDTPQGALSGVESQEYLTNATKQTGENSDTTNTTSSGTNTGTQTTENTGTQTTNATGTQKNNGTDNDTGTKDSTSVDDYTEHVVGKRGSASYSKMLQEYRETFLNIDKMVMDELEDLFFGLWM